MLGIDGIYLSRVEKISLSFAALTRSISFSTLEINFIYFFPVQYPCFNFSQSNCFVCGTVFHDTDRSTGPLRILNLK
jgi:hypothetical protein